MRLFLLKVVFFIIPLLYTGCRNKSYVGGIGSVLSFDLNLKPSIIKQYSDSLFLEGVLEIDSNLNVPKYDHLETQLYTFGTLNKTSLLVAERYPLSVLYVYSYEKEKWCNSGENFSDYELRAISEGFEFYVLEKIKIRALESVKEEDAFLYYEKCGSSLFNCKSKKHKN